MTSTMTRKDKINAIANSVTSTTFDDATNTITIRFANEFWIDGIGADEANQHLDETGQDYTEEFYRRVIKDNADRFFEMNFWVFDRLSEKDDKSTCETIAIAHCTEYESRLLMAELHQKGDTIGRTELSEYLEDNKEMPAVRTFGAEDCELIAYGA